MSLKNKYCHQLAKLFRSLPSFKGKKKLARWLLPKSYLSNNNITIIGKHDILYSMPNCIDSIGFELLVDGIYEKNTIEFMVNNIPERGVLLDIGSNIGSICLPVTKLRKDITVLCIEASKPIYECLCKNIDFNGLRNVEAFHFALSDQNSKNISFYSPLEKFGKGSLAPTFTSIAEYINTKTLDGFLDELQLSTVDFIKMDVEGFEYSVFKGAEKLLTANDAPDMLFEFVDWAEAQAYSGNTGMAQELLINYGYKLYRLIGNVDPQILDFPIKDGAAMIFATKKQINRD
jgi:FkbM family methyltransferase